MRKASGVGLLCLALALPGCTTMVRGTQEAMVVDTTPGGARVTTTLETPASKKARRKNADQAPVYYGCAETPCEFKMPRKADFLLTIEKEGYEPVIVAVEGKFGKRTLTANVAQGAGALTFAGMTGAFAAQWSALGSAGAGAGAGAGAAAATAGILLIPLGIDAANGSMLNHNPNPIELVLPPVGTEHTPDPNVAVLKSKLDRKAAYRDLKQCKKVNIGKKNACDTEGQALERARDQEERAEEAYEMALNAAKKLMEEGQRADLSEP